MYTNMQSAGLYPASGDSADWVYEAGGVTHSYTFELRDTGKHGFLLPQEQVLECLETPHISQSAAVSGCSHFVFELVA